MTRSRAVLGMSLVAVLLVSCSALGDAPARATESPVATALPTALPTAKPQRIPQGLVASGTFHSTDGTTTGAVDVVVTGHLAELVLRDLVSTHERLGVRAPLRDSEGDPCVDSHAFAFTDIVAGTPTDPLIMPLSLGRGDPTFISEIVLTTMTQADGSSHCINLVVARAPLVWTFGPLRPYLDTLVDDGIRGGASGEVVFDATGRPVTYTVAPNDLLPEVAGRFGITVDDVFYLNPARGPSPQDPMLYVDEVLNLNLRER